VLNATGFMTGLKLPPHWSRTNKSFAIGSRLVRSVTLIIQISCSVHFRASSVLLDTACHRVLRH
jgi:hypothetical protein